MTLLVFPEDTLKLSVARTCTRERNKVRALFDPLREGRNLGREHVCGDNAREEDLSRRLPIKITASPTHVCKRTKRDVKQVSLYPVSRSTPWFPWLSERCLPCSQGNREARKMHRNCRGPNRTNRGGGTLSSLLCCPFTSTRVREDFSRATESVDTVGAHNLTTFEC